MSHHVSPAENTAKLQSAVCTVMSNYTPEIQILPTAMTALQTSSSLILSSLGIQLDSADWGKVNIYALVEQRAYFQQLSYTSWHQILLSCESTF